MPEATSDTLQIRHMVLSDLENVWTWRNNPEIRRFMFNQHKITMEEHKTWFEHTSQDPHKHLLIFEEEQQPLGFVNFTDIESKRLSSWGFYLAPNAPKGSGRKLGHAALNHAFIQLALHKVCGHVLAYNDRSINFHQSLGFKEEGILRDHYFDGERYHNVICFGLLFNEWH